MNNDAYWIEEIYGTWDEEPREYAIRSGNKAVVCYMDTTQQAESMIEELSQVFFDTIAQAKAYASNKRLEIVKRLAQ